jgi:hypothetical protein
LLQPRPRPPHTEDWITDFVHDRLCIIRRLESSRRTGFLQKHQDTAPQQVLDSQQRSLCLLKPQWIKGRFRLDEYSGQFDARLAFGANGRTFSGSYAKGGFPVTDIKWRALGRTWLPEHGGWTEFDAGDLETRIGTQEVYLALGLSRSYRGECWPMVIGVHTVPDYEVAVDYDNL